LDEDIITTNNNIDKTEKKLKHVWKYNLNDDMPNFAIPGKP